MSTALLDRLRSASSNYHLQALALGAAAGIFSFAALQYRLHIFKTRQSHPELIKGESLSSETEQFPHVVVFSRSLGAQIDASTVSISPPRPPSLLYCTCQLSVAPDPASVFLGDLLPRHHEIQRKILMPNAAPAFFLRLPPTSPRLYFLFAGCCRGGGGV